MKKMLISKETNCKFRDDCCLTCKFKTMKSFIVSLEKAGVCARNSEILLKKFKECTPEIQNFIENLEEDEIFTIEICTAVSDVRAIAVLGNFFKEIAKKQCHALDCTEHIK